MKHFVALSLLFFLQTLPSSCTTQLPTSAEKSSNSSFPFADSIDIKIKELAKREHYDSAIVYAKKLLRFAIIENDTMILAKSNFRLGYYNMKLQNYEDSYDYYNQAYKIYSSKQDSTMTGSMLRSMANIQKTLGDLTGSQTTAIYGLSFLKKPSDIHKIAGLSHTISVTSKEQNEYAEALKWSDRVMKLIEESKEISAKDIRIYKNTRANILVRQGKYDQGIVLFQDLLSEPGVIPNSGEHARLLNNLGYALWLKNPNNDKSESLMTRALVTRNQIKSISGLISSHTHLSKYYSAIDTKKALDNALLALKNAKQLDNKVAILEVLDIVIPLKKTRGADLSEEAILYSKTQNKLTQTQRAIRSIYAVTKYDNDKLTNDNLLLKAQKAKKDLHNAFYLAGLLLSIVTIGFIVYLKNQQRKRTRMETEYTTEIRVAKKIHDELGNDIFYLMTQIKNDPKLLADETRFIVLEGLDKVYQKARDISKEHTPIKTDESYGGELIELLNSYGNDSIKIITTQLEPGFWDTLSKEKKIQLFWIVRELMTNMRKYSKATFVGITFGKAKKCIELNYNDNGIGFENDPAAWGNGLKYVENRIQNLNGSFNFDPVPEKGLTVKIKFPI